MTSPAAASTPSFDPASLQAITLDLDDTLWPVWPAIDRAEAVLHDWLRVHAPATAARHDTAALRRLREAVALERPDWVRAHDLGAMRLESIRRALVAAGDDPALAAPAFELFLEHRQRVDLYPDVLPALRRLAARWPLVALSNGNADIQRVPGIGELFVGAVSAFRLGCGKPEAAAFEAACAVVGAAPARTLHVGDDAALDVDGALDAGLQAAWVERVDGLRPPRGQPQHRVADLLTLAQRLGV
ncbi:HAD family hydrolase [Pseudaquabacterium rugosum]|jgi:putative hydrolase of the HAD superfamily|uniref:HAD family hydrolase n=1 Tax=Pseudaquabacterium rugosum TaxID=2984194 RepID=A0ABU9BFM1_9BURK